uniref:Uncharacterized protein n=1 Tax=Rhodnius prolixus TaxID=13249 RepID=T1HP45_RHOPR
MKFANMTRCALPFCKCGRKKPKEKKQQQHQQHNNSNNIKQQQQQQQQQQQHQQHNNSNNIKQQQQQQQQQKKKNGGRIYHQNVDEYILFESPLVFLTLDFVDVGEKNVSPIIPYKLPFRIHGFCICGIFMEHIPRE